MNTAAQTHQAPRNEVVVNQLRDYAECASHIGMESLDMLDSLLFAIGRLSADGNSGAHADAQGHVAGLISVARHVIEDSRNSLDCIREDAVGLVATKPKPVRATAKEAA